MLGWEAESDRGVLSCICLAPQLVCGCSTSISVVDVKCQELQKVAVEGHTMLCEQLSHMQYK